jgi:hypothetical protein
VDNLLSVSTISLRPEHSSGRTPPYCIQVFIVVLIQAYALSMTGLSSNLTIP